MLSQKKILLGQLGGYGDCLYATAIARQIKEDYPGCHLTWAIGSAYKSIAENNPFVDTLWEVPIESYLVGTGIWERFEEEAREKKKKGIFDEIFLTQINPNNWHNFDGMVRASIFRAYPRPIKGSVTPIVKLTDSEVRHARQFAGDNRLKEYKSVIFCEFSHRSLQSFMHLDFAIQTAEYCLERNRDACFIFSSAEKFSSPSKNIIDAGCLTFKENAELLNFCTLLIGCSSGLSWLATSDWVRPLPMIQLLLKSRSIYGSMAYDFNYWGLDAGNIIEMRDCQPDRVGECADMVLNKGVRLARRRYHENVKPRFGLYIRHCLSKIARRRYYI